MSTRVNSASPAPLRARELAGMLQQAVAALQSGRPADARRYGERALRLSPGNAACHLVLATAHQNLDQPGDAERHYTECLRLDPANVRALTNLGMLLINTDRGEEAAGHLERAVEAAPGALDARHYLARAYGLCRRYKDSVAQFRLVQQKMPDSPEVLKGLARALTSAECVLESIEVLERVHEIEPGDKSICRTLGVNHAALGDFDKAETWLREAIRIAPTETDAYLQLSTIKRLTAADVAAMQGYLSGPQTVPENNEAAFLFAIGTYHDREDDTERAFDAIARANAIKDRQSDFDRVRMATHIARMRDAVERTTTASPTSGHSSEQPVFIVGMPRSGTTLIEQVLAGHPGVFAGGERVTIPLIATDVRRRSSDYQLHLEALGAGELQALASHYLDQLPPEAAPALRVTDKMPGNVVNLPLIVRMFPKARFILCRRHPMDIAWSIYQRSFSDGLDYATSLANIADIHEIVTEFMDLWMEHVPDRSLEVAYEETVGDFETAARRIVSFCGLEWNDACLHPEAVDRGVRTASLWQVRQPVYSSSVGQWRRYASQLAETEARMAARIAAYETRLATRVPQVPSQA